MASIGEALLAALDHLEAGRLAEAESLCRRILEADPARADAWHLAGLAAVRAGRMDQACNHFATAVHHAPDRNDLRLNHAAALARLGRPQVGALRLALALEPASGGLWLALAGATTREEGLAASVGPWRVLARLRSDEASIHCSLGIVLHECGRLSDAAAAYGEAARRDPLLDHAHFNRGNALRDLGDRPGAARAYRAASAIAPADAAAARNLGHLLLRVDPQAAAAALRIAARAEPEQAAGAFDLVAALLAADRPAEALAIADTALTRHSGQADGHNGRGLALQALGRPGEAAAALERALALDPGMAGAWVNRAQSRLDRGLPGAAAADARRALRLRPDYPAALDMLARALHESGHSELAVGLLRRAQALSPALPRVLHSNLLFIRQSDPSADSATLLAEHRRWARLHAPPPGPRVLAAARTEPARRLRIGYLSADFREHSVASFFEPLLAARDPRTVHAVCYAAVPRPDGTTARLRTLADGWRDVTGLGDEALAGLIRADSIDALIDLGGHTGDSRLGVLALAPAPVRLTMLGYPGTTGLALEGRLTDPLIEPPTAQAFSSELPLPLSNGFLCYSPPDRAPDPQRRDGRGPVVFGSFNALGKLTPAVIAAWGAILRAVPGSRLLLKSRGLGDPAVAQGLRARFAGQGIAADRLDLLGWTAGRTDHLALYGSVDIGLDPFPYNGTTTTCEAMWMGVPVVTLAGDRPAARVGMALLTRAGLPDLVATDPETYRRIATDLAADAQRRAGLRPTLRHCMSNGPLGDVVGLAQAVEGICRRLLR